MCVNCHTDEFARWSLTDHAKAWLPIVQRQQTGNPECIGCHTTGYAQPGGFGEPSRSNLRKYKAVQCEACHGPYRGHPDDPRVEGRTVTMDTCLTCHDEANSPGFDWPTYLNRATCQGGAPATVAPSLAPEGEDGG